MPAGLSANLHGHGPAAGAGKIAANVMLPFGCWPGGGPEDRSGTGHGPFWHNAAGGGESSSPRPTVGSSPGRGVGVTDLGRPPAWQSTKGMFGRSRGACFLRAPTVAPPGRRISPQGGPLQAARGRRGFHRRCVRRRSRARPTPPTPTAGRCPTAGRPCRSRSPWRTRSCRGPCPLRRSPGGRARVGLRPPGPADQFHRVEDDDPAGVSTQADHGAQKPQASTRLAHGRMRTPTRRATRHGGPSCRCGCRRNGTVRGWPVAAIRRRRDGTPPAGAGPGNRGARAWAHRRA